MDWELLWILRECDWHVSVDVRTVFCGDKICGAFQHFLHSRQSNLMNWRVRMGWVVEGGGISVEAFSPLHVRLIPHLTAVKIHLLFLFPLYSPWGTVREAPVIAAQVFRTGGNTHKHALVARLYLVREGHSSSAHPREKSPGRGERGTEMCHVADTAAVTSH